VKGPTPDANILAPWHNTVHILSLAPIFREPAISSSSTYVITNHLVVTLYVHAVLFAVPAIALYIFTLRVPEDKLLQAYKAG
jgi:hypothetical protein